MTKLSFPAAPLRRASTFTKVASLSALLLASAAACADPLTFSFHGSAATANNPTSAQFSAVVVFDPDTAVDASNIANLGSFTLDASISVTFGGTVSVMAPFGRITTFRDNGTDLLDFNFGGPGTWALIHLLGPEGALPAGWMPNVSTNLAFFGYVRTLDLETADGWTLSASIEQWSVITQLAPVPEPGSGCLWAAGLAVVGLRQWRRATRGMPSVSPASGT